MSFWTQAAEITKEAVRRVPILMGVSAFLLIYIPAAFHGYGYFVDELYYLAGATRPAAGYVDHPPLSIWILFLSDADSLEYLRVFPALCGAFTVYLASSFVRLRLGSPAGQFLAGLCVLAAPVLLVLFGFYSMNAFEILFVTVLAMLLSEMIRRDKPLWIWFGVVAGLSVLNKHTSAVYAGALLAGLACTQQRKLLFDRTILYGGIAALVIVLPNLIWQADNSFVSLEFYANASSFKNVRTLPHMVLFNQILAANPLTLLVWAAGLAFCWKSELRVFAIAYGICLVILMVSQSSRPDRIAAFYPVLFAAGALWFDRKRILRAGALVLAFAGLVGFAPVGLPVLEPAETARYAAFIGVVPSIEKGRSAGLPQWFADRLGWPETARRASELVREQGPDTIVIASTYGLAAAIERFGGVQVVSPHNSYFLWAKEKDLKSYRRAILVGFSREAIQAFCKPEDLGFVDRPFSDPVPLFACDTEGKLAEVWPRIRKLL